MTVGQIAELGVGDLAADDCALFLWVTPELFRRGVGAEVAEAWGFVPVAEIIWRKPSFGMGAFPRSGHEPVLVARRGTGLAGAPRNIHSVQDWAQGRASANGGKVHSAKPDGLADLVERAFPGGPWLEVFARRARFGWEYAGDQSIATVEIRGVAH